MSKTRVEELEEELNQMTITPGHTASAPASPPGRRKGDHEQ